jgi:hypothetical protein
MLNGAEAMRATPMFDDPAWVMVYTCILMILANSLFARYIPYLGFSEYVKRYFGATGLVFSLMWLVAWALRFPLQYPWPIVFSPILVFCATSSGRRQLIFPMLFLSACALVSFVFKQGVADAFAFACVFYAIFAVLEYIKGKRAARLKP